MTTTLKRTLCISLAVILGFLFLILGVIIVLFFRAIVDAFIAGELPLRQNSQTFELWRKPPLTPYLKVYFFNVTNHPQFLEAPTTTKLHLKEVGPYVYSEKWEKVDPIWHPNGTLSYRQVKNFTFEPSLSFGGEEDLILLPNIPMLSAVSQMGHSTRIIKKAVSTILDVLKLEPFQSRRVRDFLWGYDDPLIKLAKGVLPAEKRFPFDQFGFFVGKNATPSEVFTVLTGKENLDDFARITVYGGKDSLGVWATPECNQLKGSDGTGFPAMMNENTTVYVFQPDFCRPIQLVVKNKGVTYKHEGFETLRFQPADHVFGSVDDYPGNQCYCAEGNCSPKGVFNVSLCQFNSPVFLSWPHFLNADPKLSEPFIGLNPKPELHSFYMDIQPKLGLAMQAKGRVQINIQMTKVDEIPQTQNLTNILIPVVWFEDGIDKLPPTVLGLIRQAINMPEVAEAALSYVLFISGGLLIVGGIMYMLRNNYASSKTKLATGNGVNKVKMDGFKEPLQEKEKPSNNGLNKNLYSSSNNASLELDEKGKSEKNGHTPIAETPIT